MWTGIRRCFGKRWGSWGRAVGQSRSEGVEGTPQKIFHTGGTGEHRVNPFLQDSLEGHREQRIRRAEAALIDERFARC
jgi:hypothetical protein